MNTILTGVIGIGAILFAASFFFRGDEFKKMLAIWGILLMIGGLLAGLFLTKCPNCGSVTYRFVDKCIVCKEEFVDDIHAPHEDSAIGRIEAARG